VWVGGIDIAEGALRYGLFLQFWLYVNLLLNPVRELGERYNVLQSAFASAERIFPCSTPSRARREREARAPRRARRAPCHVRFENVSFSYVPKASPVLHDVSFEIPPGSTVAVVGATGAGKSTLVNLLLRFYDPSAAASRSTASTSRVRPRALRRRSSDSCCRRTSCSRAPCARTW
jgi:ATP-binding cassette subfamily B multidrug efflux pump